VAQGGRVDLHNSRTERSRRAAIVRSHRERYGDWCPGWGVESHAATDLTADHVIGVGSGGAPHGACTVLCRSCNARKGKHLTQPNPLPATRSRNWV